MAVVSVASVISAREKMTGIGTTAVGAHLCAGCGAGGERARGGQSARFPRSCPRLLPAKVQSHCSLQRAPTRCHGLPGEQSEARVVPGDGHHVFRKGSQMSQERLGGALRSFGFLSSLELGEQGPAYGVNLECTEAHAHTHVHTRTHTPGGKPAAVLTSAALENAHTQALNAI